MAEEHDLPELKARAFGNIGSVRVNLSDYTKALDYYDKALNIHEELGNKAGVALRLSNIGRVHEKQQEYDVDMEYDSRSLHLQDSEEHGHATYYRGENISDFFPAVSIAFADIVGFTPIKANMEAKVVERFLNFIFAQFDRVMKEHGCDKIKTMVHEYMEVSGVPLQCEDHAERIACAGLVMQADIRLNIDIRQYIDQGTVFNIGIGIHTCPAVEGVISDQHFVYDVYSDAINLALRMESQGEAGRIHCSQVFAMHLQNRDESFVFEESEEIEIKGKGMMRTYFLEKA